MTTEACTHPSEQLRGPRDAEQPGAYCGSCGERVTCPHPKRVGQPVVVGGGPVITTKGAPVVVGGGPVIIPPPLCAWCRSVVR